LHDLGGHLHVHGDAVPQALGRRLHELYPLPVGRAQAPGRPDRLHAMRSTTPLSGETRPGLAGILVGLLLALLAAEAAAAAPPDAVSRSADPRLDRKVNLKLPRSPLSEVAAQLGRQTGVSMTASAEVADEPAVVFVADLPLAEAMDRLASLFNYRWERSGTAPSYRYALRQDRESAAPEEARRDQDRLQ